jgi:hypothetical protein
VYHHKQLLVCWVLIHGTQRCLQLLDIYGSAACSSSSSSSSSSCFKAASAPKHNQAAQSIATAILACKPGCYRSCVCPGLCCQLLFWPCPVTQWKATYSNTQSVLHFTPAYIQVLPCKWLCAACYNMQHSQVGEQAACSCSHGTTTHHLCRSCKQASQQEKVLLRSIYNRQGSQACAGRALVIAHQYHAAMSCTGLLLSCLRTHGTINAVQISVTELTC